MTATPAASPFPRVLLRSEESAGQVSVIEIAPGPGVGPPLHSHGFDEALHVMEGELTFRVRDEYVTVGRDLPAIRIRSHVSPAPARL